MLKNNVKKVAICLIMLAVLGLVLKINFVKGNDIFNQLPTPQNSVENIAEGNRVNNTPNENTGSENLQNNTNVNTNTNANVNKPATTPYTGIGDNSSIIFITIFIASAVYAFIKIKKYEF